MTAGISHFAIRVRDLATAERFYCGVLGLPIERRWPDDGGTGTRSLWLRTGDPAGTFLALEVIPDEPAAGEPAPVDGGLAPNSGHYLLALRIARAERDTYLAKLEAAGVAVSRGTAFTIYFTDPEGNRLGLSHYPEPRAMPDANEPA